MANQILLPLYEKIPLKNTLQRSLDIIVLFLLISLLLYRLFSLNNHGFPWLLAFVCESWFTFNWLLLLNCKWNPVECKTYPQNLQQRFPDLPRVDMFVTTADPELEPALITVNTILSLLAVDYPAEKLACYVSDDACSALSFYSLVEASKFSKLWVPFCKKHNIQVRAPFRYFAGDSQPFDTDTDSEFRQDWLKTKAEYELLAKKIGEPIPCDDLSGDNELAVFDNVERRNHPTIISIISEHKENDSDTVPNLVYISREKRAKQLHHYKAGALNVLTRVSGVMTNAAFMLNVDCDMFVNNPQVVRHAICQLLGSETETETGFIQYPQVFYDGSRDDPYGNQFVTFFLYICRGVSGIQGSYHCGSGCFHRRKVIYGSLPTDDAENDGKLVDGTLVKEFGNSEEFVSSTAQALKGKNGSPHNLSESLEAAYQVASVDYEYGTSWGTKCGWMYGSATEDALTGLRIHKTGWNSTLHILEQPAFTGCAPSGGPQALTQHKRWVTGLLEILVSKHSPIIATFNAKLQFRMCLAYMWLQIWGLHSIPELCYAILPAYCILTDTHFLPKVGEAAIWIPISIFVTVNLHTLREYLKTGLSMRAWWNNHRMGRIKATSANLFGMLTDSTIFEVTQKDQASSDGDDSTVATRFTFNASALFVPGTTTILIHLVALVNLSLRLASSSFRGVDGVGVADILCSLWVVLCFRPFLKGLFETGKHGIPSSTILKSAALAFLFLLFCKT